MNATLLGDVTNASWRDLLQSSTDTLGTRASLVRVDSCTECVAHTLIDKCSQAANKLRAQYPCNVRVVNEFPNRAQLQALLERQEPVLVRVSQQALDSPYVSADGSRRVDLRRSYFGPVSLFCAGTVTRIPASLRCGPTVGTNARTFWEYCFGSIVSSISRLVQVTASRAG